MFPVFNNNMTICIRRCTRYPRHVHSCRRFFCVHSSRSSRILEFSTGTLLLFTNRSSKASYYILSPAFVSHRSIQSRYTVMRIYWHHCRLENNEERIISVYVRLYDIGDLLNPPYRSYWFDLLITSSRMG